MITEEQKGGLKEIFQKHNVGIAYLFGSQARGTANVMSDTDVAVVFDAPPPRGRYLHGEDAIADLEDYLKMNVDLVDLAAAKDPLLKHQAVFQGECIFGGNNPKRFLVESSIMKEYEDTAHLRNVQYRIMAERIKRGRFGARDSTPVR